MKLKIMLFVFILLINSIAYALDDDIEKFLNFIDKDIKKGEYIIFEQSNNDKTLLLKAKEHIKKCLLIDPLDEQSTELLEEINKKLSK